MLGGLLERNAMYLGFRAFHLIGIVCYLLAFASELVFRSPLRETDLPAQV